MAFYCPDGAMAQQLEASLAALEADGRPGLREQVSISWMLNWAKFRITR